LKCQLVEQPEVFYSPAWTNNTTYCQHHPLMSLLSWQLKMAICSSHKMGIFSDFKVLLSLIQKNTTLRLYKSNLIALY
jgi:hypothetical protein